DAARAAMLYELFSPYASRTVVTGPAVVCLGPAARYLGLLAGAIGRPDDAARHFEESIAMNDRMGARPYLAHSLREYGEMLGRNGDGARARSLMDRAADLYRALGMDTFVRRPEALLGAESPATEACR